jgi:hypothetical protein
VLLSSLGAHGTSADDLSGWIAIGVSAGSLLIASVTGWLGVRFSRRALRLSERQEARQNLQPDLYLSTSRAWPTDSGRVLAALVRVSNPSDRGTSIVAADLRLSYYVGGSGTSISRSGTPTGAMRWPWRPWVSPLRRPGFAGSSFGSPLENGAA